MKYDAILFDLDGTLVQTTHLYEEACIAGMRSIGLEFSSEDFARLYPAGYSIAGWITDKAGDPARLQEVRSARDVVFHELLATKSEYCTGARELLAFLDSHPTGVITNSWRSYVDAMHRKIAICDHITNIVTADDMGNFCKPHPHGLLMAADKLGVEPRKSVYVGDQIFDLEAAKAAGMTACLIHGPHTPRGLEEHADIVVQSLAELQQMIQ